MKSLLAIVVFLSVSLNFAEPKQAKIPSNTDWEKRMVSPWGIEHGYIGGYGHGGIKKSLMSKSLSPELASYMVVLQKCDKNVRKWLKMAKN